MKNREIVALEPRKLTYREYEERPLEANEVRIDVENAAVKHATEFLSFRGIDPFVNSYYDEGKGCFLDRTEAQETFEMRPGNMWVGIIREKGPQAQSLSIGQRVAGYGPLRPTQVIPAEKCLIMPDKMTWKQAVYYDPMQFAFCGIRDGQVRIGDQVAVIGLGAIGLAAAQLAKLAGASRVIVADPIAARRQAALDNGADIALDSASCDVGLEIRNLTSGRGADVLVECSGAYAALQAAIRGVAYGGNVAVVGWYKECLGGLHLGLEAHFNQPNIIMSRACNPVNRDYPRWDFSRICDACWELLARGTIRCENIVDPVVPFSKAAEMYMQIERDPGASVKMGVSYQT